MILTSLPLLFIFIFVSFKINHSTSKFYYSLDELYKTFDNLKANENDLKTIVDCLSSTFNEAYAFNQIAKNPPQPSFDSNYHKKVDIQKELQSLNLKNISMYKFYQDIKLIFDRLADQHLGININGFEVKNYHFGNPLRLVIKEYENKTRMFGEIKIEEYEYRYFRNNDTIFKVMKDNINTPIKTINGKDPFDFITDFGGDYEKLRSPHACFRYKFNEHNADFDFFEYPLNKEDLVNFTVVYDNGDNFTTDFVAYSGYASLNNIQNNVNLFIDNIRKSKEMNDELKLKNILKDILTFRKDRIFNNIIFDDKYEPEKKVESLNADKKWNYNYENSIACREDNDNKINIMGLVNFGLSIDMDYITTIKQCSRLFDANNYPIIVVNILNGGGLITNSQFLLESLSPNLEMNIYGRMRYTDIIKENKIVDSLFQGLSDIEGCDPLSYSKIMKTKQKVDYGNSVTDTLIGPFLYTGRDFRAILNEFKRSLKRPRKPTEIIVYTDSFSYSATALLLKYLQYYGGGITVGYFTNPNLDDIPFDSSLSPSSIFTHDSLAYLGPKGYDTLSDKYGYNLVMAGTQSFYTPKDYQCPLEFVVTPVDEKVKIYLNVTVKTSRDAMNASLYDAFINDSLRIFEHYKTYCNPKNKKLLLISSECDGQFSSHAHGGYECGDDGKWSKKCVASYCDIGYIFDHEKKKCIESSCALEDITLKLIIILIVIFVVIIGAIVISYICIKIRRKRREKSYYDSVEKMNEKMNLNENLN